jgi:NTP pyrophosphatase (non-canonical NTP hydrolase)
MKTDSLHNFLSEGWDERPNTTAAKLRLLATKINSEKDAVDLIGAANLVERLYRMIVTATDELDLVEARLSTATNSRPGQFDAPVLAQRAAEQLADKPSAYEDLEHLVLCWSRDRGIIPNATPVAQLLKAVSEMGELADAVNKNHFHDMVDAVGDVVVCLINLCELKDVSLTFCLQEAYDQIKDRKGYLNPNGVFVKEEA